MNRSKKFLDDWGEVNTDWVSGSITELLPDLLAVIKILKVIPGTILFSGDAC